MSVQPDLPDDLEEQVFVPEHLARLYPGWDEARYPAAMVTEMGQAKDLSEIFDCITFWMQRLFAADRTSVVLEDGNGMLTVWALRGSSASRMDKSIPKSRGRLGRALADGMLILSRDLKDCSEPDSRSLYENGLRRAINAPLKAASRCFGAINTCYEDEYAVGPREAFDLQMFANWVAPLIRYQQELQTTASEARIAKAEIDRARGEASAKTSFIANISHEIRTPLNGILGMAQLLASDTRDARQAEMVDTILSSGNALLKILNDLIDISRIDAGRMSILPVRNTPRAQIERIVRLWTQHAHQGGLKLSLSIDETVPDCLIYDATRAEQCISNLISNAIKFTDEGEIRVVVSAETGSNQSALTISVSDTGCGIAPEEIEELFEPFRQADQSTQRQAHGAGLGLSICRKIARLMGGDVTANSVLGSGSVFLFRFVGRNAQGTGEITDNEQPVLRRPDTAGLTGKRVLVVEDIPTNRVVIEMMLNHLGMSVEHAENGRIALDLMKRQEFDLVLLDMHMPVMDGAETIAAIRAAPDALREMKVIALTADALHGDRERHLSMGLNGYVAKPIDAKALVHEIKRLIA